MEKINMWTEDIFGVKKPIIAMLHLLPLPGDPSYDEVGGIEKVLNRAHQLHRKSFKSCDA